MTKEAKKVKKALSVFKDKLRKTGTSEIGIAIACTNALRFYGIYKNSDK